MHNVGTAANSAIIPACAIDNAETSNTPLNAGIHKTIPSNPTPAKKAAILHLFVNNPNRNIIFFPLQLNPWNNLANVSVANAMVLAVIASDCNPI